jgi:group I intron endonuclease
MTIGRVYQIINMKNGKKYIGSTKVKLSQRFAEHKRYCKQKPERPLYIAFKEYGIENFKMELLETVKYENREELNKVEGDFIRMFDTFNNGYNKNIAGRTIKEWVVDNKEKIKKINKNYYKNHKEIINKKTKEYREKNRKICKYCKKVFVSAKQTNFLCSECLEKYENLKEQDKVNEENLKKYIEMVKRMKECGLM